MPGGLSGVEQTFTADASGYISEIQAMIKANQGLVQSVAEAKRAVGDAGKAPGGSGADDIAKVNQAIRDQLRILGDYSRAVRDVSAATGEMGRAHIQAADVTSGHADAVSDLTDSYESARASAVEMARAQQAANDAATTLITSHLRGNRVLADGSSAARSYASDLGSVRDAARDTTRELQGVADALAAPAGGGGGGSLADWWKTIRPGGAGGGQTFFAPGVWPPRAATSSDYGPTAAQMLAQLGAAGGGGGSGGGGGGGIPGGSGAFVPWRGGGFQAIKFWSMAIGEFAATAVPALVAAGAASAVGMKGAEDVILRARALGTTVQALGPAYGVTMGSVLGTSGALGRAQNAARGGVYELAGAGIDFAKMGGGAFSQMGVNTLAMVDRGVANMLINYQNKQAAGQGGAGLLAGGTQWLRRYGDLGANIGDTLMNLAPYEPGIGGDVLNSLVGGTGFLKQATQDIPGPLLGAIMSAEGGMRWGKAILGGKGLLGRVLGLGKVGGVGGLLGKAGEGLFSRGMGGTLGDVGLGMMGAGDALAGAAGPISLAAALSAFGFSELAGTMPSPAQRQVAALQAGVNQAGFSAAFQPLGHAITTATGLAATAGGGGPGADMLGASEAPSTFARFGPIGPTARQIYQNAATGFGATMDNLIGAGPQLVSALQKAGLKGVSMGDAFQIAQNSLLDLSHAFNSHGKLTKTSQQMLSNYVSAIGPMTRSGGAFNAAIEGQQIMSSPAMQDVAKVNQAMDSMTQVMSGGPAGMAGLFSILGGTPTTHKVGGINFTAPPAFKKMAQALTSFSSVQGSAAWGTFAGPSGLVAAEQQNLDQLRTAMTLGAIGPGGAAGLAGMQIGQMLPLAKKSPAALAMLMQQGQQMGIGGYYQGDPSKPGVQAANYAAAEKAFGHIADSSKAANAATNAMTVNLSRLPQVAQQFSQGFNANIQSQEVAKAATAMTSVIGAAGKGAVSTGGISTLVAQMKQAGLTAQSIGPVIQHALQGAGVGAGMQKKIMLQVGADTAAAQAKIAALHGKNVDINIMTKGAQQAQAEMDAIHGKTVTVTIVQRVIQQVITSGAAAAAASGIPSFSMPGGPAGMRIHAQTGGMVPGSGSGDIIPAMLEPGEAIIPRYLVPLIAPILASHRVPGFGGVPQASSSHFAAGGIAGAGSTPWLPYWEYEAKKRGWVPPTIHSGTGGGASTVDGTAKQFAFTLTGKIAEEVKNAAGAKKIADALITKIGQEVALAKNVSSAAMQGQGFGNSGIFGSMDVTPGTGNGTVMEQMQSYLGSVQSFTKDLGTLRKDHLNKNIISQLVGAGPVQGDALAQSILNDYGGVKGVNQVWGQLGKATKGLGNQAELAQYGGLKASNTSVSININAGAGGAAGLNLTTAQIKQIVAQVQAALLKQAKRNPKTGIQLSGKGA